MPTPARSPTTPTTASSPPEGGLEAKVTAVGRGLTRALDAVLAEVPGGPHAPQALARILGVDKVLTSRLLKAATRDPMAVVHHLPGPEPLRRVLRAAQERGASAQVIREATEIVGRFEDLIRQDAGDRGTLDGIISAWLPEVRRDFELRRKQTAFKAISQLKGAMAETNLATVVLHPSADGTHLDVVWIIGLIGLQRLRPGVTVKFATRRMTEAEDEPRRPASLDGAPVMGVEDARLDDYCDGPPAELRVERAGKVVHYVLAGDAFGPNSATDLVLAEVNMSEMPRYVPRERGRKGYVFAEVGTPARTLLFDVLVHEDVYPGSEPGLVVYDTALDGIADVNDRARDVDRLDLLETVQMLGRGTGALRIAQFPRYVELLRHVFERTGWNDRDFRGYRCRIDYPVYGSQAALTFDPPPPPGGP